MTIVNPCTNKEYTRGETLSTNNSITIVVSSYKGYNEVRCIVYSFLCQKLSNWEMIVGHDGPDEMFKEVAKEFEQYNNIRWFATKERENVWGYNVRNQAINMINTEWVVNTNDDNYYVPIYTQELSKYTDVDIIYYDCVHNHEIPFSSNGSSYGMLIPRLQQDHIDLGQYAIKTSLLKQHRFNKDNPAADGELITKLRGANSKYINKCLFVHN